MVNSKSNNNFPKDFYWGASTAAHQVEGGNVNQWSVWEQANATKFSKLAHTRIDKLPKWNKIKDQAEDPANYISGDGVNHYERYQEDFDIIQKLNFNAFRFGVEWSRIEPEEGKWDETAISHYKQYIKELRNRGLEPFANIWHWTVPTWFAEKGDFENKQNIEYFVRFVQKIADELVDDLTYVITLNEPNVYTAFSYVTGEWPPEKKNLWTALRVYKNLLKAHQQSFAVLKKKKPQLQVGLAVQLANFQPKRLANLFDKLTTKVTRYFWNWWFVDRCRNYQDFVGFNYYFTDYIRGLKRDNPKSPLNDLGWYMEPSGVGQLIIDVSNRYKKPIIVTENGVADEEDKHRRWWLEETIDAIAKAIETGADVRGYLHWSLLDNFEWKYGWWPKFGLVEVDRENKMKRTIRPSAQWFADKITSIKNE